MPIENGSQLCETAVQVFLREGQFMPYLAEKTSAVYLGKHVSELTSFFREVASGFLGCDVYQELTLSSFVDNPILAQKVHDEFNNGRLLITNVDSLEEKVFLFKNTSFVMDVLTFKFLMQSHRWVELLEYCYKQQNKFVIMGTIVKDKYVHHSDVPKLDLLVLVPQFISDTSEPPELEIGTQMLKKRKNESKK